MGTVVEVARQTSPVALEPDHKAVGDIRMFRSSAFQIYVYFGLGFRA